MVELFNNKYRIKSTRLKSWDYSSEGAYYVTICTRNRQCFFGEIENETMRFSTIGEIVNSCWNEIPMHYRNVSIDKYIIMPNHLHGILIIYTVETCHGMSLRKKHNQFSKPISNSLSIIINQFKSAVKRLCNKNNQKHFKWQSRFYEHIIRNENDMNRIREYITDNALQWNIDHENPNKRWLPIP